MQIGVAYVAEVLSNANHSAVALPAACALAGWRRDIAALYATIREEPEPEIAWSLWRGTRARMFREHRMSPLDPRIRSEFRNIAVFQYDPSLRFAVHLTEASGGFIEYDLGDDGDLKITPAARTIGLAKPLGAELTIYWIGGYGGGLFLPFRDATSGRETYDGGRYIIDTIKGADLGYDGKGRMILDFNFAYNPSCAMNEDYISPLPPLVNTLPNPVRGGERAF